LVGLALAGEAAARELRSCRAANRNALWAQLRRPSRSWLHCLERLAPEG